MDTYTYRIGDNLYLNLTNRCSNACSFCVRRGRTYEGYDLWLEREPSAAEVIARIGDPKAYREIVFCGYGEPTCRLAALLEIAEFVRTHGGTVRLNTNGHGSLLNHTDIVPLLVGKVDRVNVSLNAATRAKYEAICHPTVPGAFEATLAFGQACKRAGLDAWFSVVDEIGAAEVEAARALADSLGMRLRVRAMIQPE